MLLCFGLGAELFLAQYMRRSASSGLVFIVHPIRRPPVFKVSLASRLVYIIHRYFTFCITRLLQPTRRNLPLPFTCHWYPGWIRGSDPPSDQGLTTEEKQLRTAASISIYCRRDRLAIILRTTRPTTARTTSSLKAATIFGELSYKTYLGRSTKNLSTENAPTIYSFSSAYCCLCSATLGYVTLLRIAYNCLYFT